MIKTIRYWIIKMIGVSKGEANALLVLVPLLLSTIIVPPFAHKYLTENYSNHISDQAILDSIILSIEEQKTLTKLKSSSKSKVSHVSFDPNSSSIEVLVANGIPNYLANRIISYRSKGGQFRKKEDLLKIYGFEDELFETLHSYINIKVIEHKPIKTQAYNNTSKGYKKKKIKNFDINNADMSTLKQIYGIGEKLSMRIVKFRDKLGGFIHTDQLKQVYGLRTETIDSLLNYGSISSNFTPNQININTDTIKHLSQHPFIDYKLAKAIINYRRQHGEYKQSIDLKKIHLMNDSVYNKIEPYLKLVE